MLFEELYTLYYKKLLAAAYQEVYDLDQAEDFVQRTFLAALYYRYDPERGANPYTWLHNLLKWEIQSYYREVSEHSIPADSILPIDEVGEEMGIYSHINLERMVDAAICIKRLSPALRWLAEALFVEGYTVEEIVKKTGVPKRSIERLVTNIYDKFRDHGRGISERETITVAGAA